MARPSGASRNRWFDDYLDLVLERDGAIVGIEVKAGERVRDADFRSLRKLHNGRDYARQRHEPAADAWRRGLDRRDTRSLWKKANREFEATLEAGIPGVARATVRGRQTERARSPLAQVHALLALPERLAAASKRRILVVFDEFQDLLTAGEDLDGLVRSHVQHHVDIAGRSCSRSRHWRRWGSARAPPSRRATRSRPRDT